MGVGGWGILGTCEGATPSLALRISSLMLIPAPFLITGFVGVPWGVPYGVPAGVSSDLADRVAELGMLLGLLPGFPSSTDALADAHLVGLDPGVQLGLLLG